MNFFESAFRYFPESAGREPPPPPRRYSDGSFLSEEEGNSHTSIVGDDGRLILNSRTRPYYFRRCKRVRPTNIESLPNELLSDILLRLPADHLYDRARLVCRRWYHIVHSYDFINTQIQHSTYGLLVRHREHWGGYHPILITATQDGPIETSEFSYLCRTLIFISCNGLGLEVFRCQSVPYIINPATKKSFILPSIPTIIFNPARSGIGFAPLSMRYKLTISYGKACQEEYCLAILTFGVDNSWRDVVLECLPKDCRRTHFLRSPLVTEGFLHWVTRHSADVLTLDMETEIVTVTRIPFSVKYIQQKDFYYLSTGHFLSLLIGHKDLSWDVWGMKSETGEWRKVLPGINLRDQKCRLKQLASAWEDQILEPFGWVNYPQVLALCFRSRRFKLQAPTPFIFYNLETHEISSTELPYSGECYSGIVHKNSLTWLS